MKTLFTTTLFMLLINIVLIAQDDNIKIEVLNDTTTTQYDKILKYFLIEKNEVKQLFKVDLFQLALKRPNFGYERKLTNNSSIEFNGLSTYDISGSTSNSLLNSTSNLLYKVFYMYLNTDYKYYYNINRRIAKGKNTNGFSANYFSVGLSAHLTFFDNNNYYINNIGLITPYYRTDYSESPAIIKGTLKKHEGRESTGFINFGYGLQRRIGNIGYVASDIKLGLGTNKDFDCLWIMPQISVRAGFAISSFRRK